MWTQIDKPVAVKMSHALAKEFRDMEPCPHDRPLNDKRVRLLQAKYDSGEFRSCVWAKCYCEETKKWYRVNGKHSSNMFAEMNGKLPKGHSIFVLVEQYTCPTLEDVAKLYSSFDSRSSARSANDIYRVFAATNSHISDISAKIVNNCVGAIAFATYEHTVGSTTPETRAALMLENVAFVRWVAALTHGQDAAHVLRVPPLAAAFKTWQKNAKDATAFWEAVRDGSGTNFRSPDRVLNKYLLKTKVGANGARGEREIANRHEMYVKCIHAWNAWKRNETTALNYYANAKTPNVA